MNKIVEAEETQIEDKEPDKPLVNKLEDKVVYVDLNGEMTDEDYYMTSDIFDYGELTKMNDFAIKRYKNALYKG